MKAHLFVVLALLSFSACKSGSPDPVASEGSGATEVAGAEATDEAGEQIVTLYCGRNEAMVAPLIAQFEEATGIDVRVNYAGSGQLAATMLEEGDNSPADVFLSQDSATLGLLEREGVLAPLPEEVLGRVSSSFRSSSGHWVGTSGRARVVTYNTESVSPADLPATIDGFTDPAWKGRVGWSPENASFQSFLTIYAQMNGPEATRTWVQGMLDNEARAFPSNTPGVIAVANGEIDAMITNHYYLYRVVAEQGPDTPIANHYLRDSGAGSLVNVSGVAIRAGAENAEPALALVEFLLSEPAQVHFANENAEFPVIEGVETTQGLPDIASLQAPEVDLGGLDDLEVAVTILQETGAL